MATLTQMMQNLLSQKDPLLPNETKRVILKEFMQAFTLDFLYNHAQYRKLNFYGGTCLHVIYGLNRLSEDIDLDNSKGINLDNLAADLEDYFRAKIGYDEVITRSQVGERGILRIILKFPLLYDLGLSSHANETLHLKVEVSQHKQISVIQKTPMLLFGRSFVSAHFSLETMMAGKILACLEREFSKGPDLVTFKGRDFYDLLWFMQQKIKPLEEKLAKDGEKTYTIKSAMELLGNRIRTLQMTDLAEDLRPLFEQRQFIEAWLEGFKDNYFEYEKYYLQ